MKKLCFVVAMILLASMLVTSASLAAHEHEWGPWVIIKEPTCREQGRRERTCILSGCSRHETEPLAQVPHDWLDPTCTKPQRCRFGCGTSIGKPRGHSFVAATCVQPKTCSVCHLKEGGLGKHAFRAATCVKPMTCSVCTITSGKPLGHNWITDGDIVRCTRCPMVRRQVPRPPQSN